MDFRKADVREVRNRVQGCGSFVELDGEVARIEIQADAIPDDFWRICRVVKSLEKRESLGGVLEMTERFRFEAEVKIDLVFLRKIFDEPREFREIGTDD